MFQVGIKALIQNSKKEILMLHIPEWSGNQAHYDLPGGRIDKVEDFLDTLNRELKEEIGVSFTGHPKQLTAFKTNITIPVASARVPLIFVIYEVEIVNPSNIKLDPNGREDKFGWFSPREAAKEMHYKFPAEFCEYIASLD